MSKIEAPFHIHNNPDFRFAIVLESRSVESHSLMDSDNNKKNIHNLLDNLVIEDLVDYINMAITKWKEEHK